MCLQDDEKIIKAKLQKLLHNRGVRRQVVPTKPNPLPCADAEAIGADQWGFLNFPTWVEQPAHLAVDIVTHPQPAGLPAEAAPVNLMPGQHIGGTVSPNCVDMLGTFQLQEDLWDIDTADAVLLLRDGDKR